MSTQNTRERKRRWVKIAKRYLLGRRIVGVHWMTKAKQEECGWDRAALVLVLDDGSLVWPSSDDEGNDAGALFGHDQNGEFFCLPVFD